MIVIDDIEKRTGKWVCVIIIIIIIIIIIVFSNHAVNLVVLAGRCLPPVVLNSIIK